MKKLILAAVFASLGSVAMAADPIVGIWQTKKDDNGNFGHVQVKPCGALFCGTLIKAFDGAGKEIQSPNVGKPILWDMKAYADGVYDDGKIWSPDRDKTYNGELKLAGGKMTVYGCVLGICRDGGTWTKVK